MEIIGQVDGVTVIDDFAHHPTAVQTTLEGAKRRYPDHQLWALFEPRSATTCRNIFQKDYAASFDAAHKVLFAPLGRELPKNEALDIEQLKSDLQQRSVHTETFSSIDALYEYTLQNVPQNTILLCMSNGAFGGIHTRLIEGLKLR